eukprot:m.188089 g.188089  ORF g.188089 m.188089 type:complete len:239 (-) comp15078_c0_seq14:429-1145(-)
MVPLVLALTTSIGRPNTVQDFPIENEAREIPSMGPFAINLTVVTIGGFVTPTKTQTAYVYYPVSGPTHGPFPFVVYMHGMAMDIEPDQMKTLYEGEWEAIASHGFVVAAPRSGDGVSYYQDFYKDQLRTIEVARELGASLSPALANADFSHVGVAGHSMGGDATCRSAAAPGYNISAAVALHPSMWPTMNRGAFAPTNIEVPTFFGTGNLDVVVRVWHTFARETRCSESSMPRFPLKL